MLVKSIHCWSQSLNVPSSGKAGTGAASAGNG